MMIREGRPTINFLDSYRAHYRGFREDLFIKEVEPLGESGEGVRLSLCCEREDFAFFNFSVGDGDFYKSKDNAFIIRFEDKNEWNGKFQSVYENGEKSSTRTIKATRSFVDPRQETPDSPSTSISININPPLELFASSPDRWVKATPSYEEREFAMKHWGKVVSDSATDYDNAKALAKILCDELWPHTGCPIPEMQYYTPFEMYKTMMTGKSEGFCVQFAMIFVRACECFDIIARNMHMERPVHYGKDLNVFLQGMHSTSEVFDRALDRWIFMDLRFFCLGAYLGEEGPLSIGEFHLFMNQPHWRDRLRFQVYDMETNTEKRLPMNDCPRTNIDFYSGWNTVFHVGYE